MKKTIFKADERGFTNHKWLKSYHTFSFANYYDENRSGFGKLLVLNEDSVQPGAGFGTHTHDNMEIISIPLMGQMAHKDNLGNESIIKKGEVQVISAGKGLTHSEFNPSRTNGLHFLEIWIIPDQVNVEPRYQVKSFKIKDNVWAPIIRQDKLEGCLSIYQDASLYYGKFNKNIFLSYSLINPFHGIFLMVINGKIEILEEHLHQYDGLAMEGKAVIDIYCLDDSDLLLIEIPLETEET